MTVSEEFRKDVIESRINVLKSMHEAICNMNDENAYLSWIMIAVPDEPSEDDFQFIAEETEEYIGCCKHFAKVVSKYAKYDL